MMLQLIVFTLFVVTSSSSFAAPRSFTVKSSKESTKSPMAFKIDMPTTWRALENYFEIPLSLVGPVTGEARPIIQITPTDVPIKKIEAKELKSRQLEYRTGRLNWLGGYDGTPIEFFKFKTEDWANLGEVQSIGYRYKLAEKEYVEYSYYAVCDEKLLMVQTLMHKSHEKSLKSEFEKILNSIRCGKAS